LLGYRTALSGHIAIFPYLIPGACGMSHPGSTKHDNTYEHCGANHVFQYEVFHDVLPIGHPAKLLYRHTNPTTESFRTLAYERRNESADTVNGYNRKRMNECQEYKSKTGNGWTENHILFSVCFHTVGHEMTPDETGNEEAGMAMPM
jgi:hypothetical protein